MKCIVYTGTTASMDPALTDRLVDAACDFHYHECKFTPEMAPKLIGQCINLNHGQPTTIYYNTSHYVHFCDLKITTSSLKGSNVKVKW